MLDEDVVEALVVVGGSAEYRVFEEREGEHVRGPKVAEEVVAPVQQVLEEKNRIAHPGGELDDARGVELRLLLLYGDQVRRALPDVVEPVHEYAYLGATCRRARKQGWVWDALFEPIDDRRRVADDLASVDEYRDETLAAHCFNRRAVIRVDVDPLDFDRLVPGGERDSLDIGREGNAVDANQIQFFRLKNQSWPNVVATITPHENA